ncbi:hypothetical protein TIFTF001_007735 [Ficus carica]|uniref:Uncharacterized protein n=1 Tax=Ficus carica TaxID=3494 RepID=A0AA87ZRR3_FICCA|nr:hypothetical protein TIFTF001_007735 [Ficus carica]
MSTYEKYTAPPEPAAAMDYPATGIPVNSSNQHYTNNNGSQPAPVLRAPVAAWSTGLFGCFSDVKNCRLQFPT